MAMAMAKVTKKTKNKYNMWVSMICILVLLLKFWRTTAWSEFWFANFAFSSSWDDRGWTADYHFEGHQGERWTYGPCVKILFRLVWGWSMNLVVGVMVNHQLTSWLERMSYIYIFKKSEHLSLNPRSFVGQRAKTVRTESLMRLMDRKPAPFSDGWS